MEPLQLMMMESSWSLTLDVGTPVDEVITRLGHEPNGYFWESLAALIIRERMPELEGKFEFDSEGDLFAAHGRNRQDLERLGHALSNLIGHPGELERLVELANRLGDDFYDLRE